MYFVFIIIIIIVIVIAVIIIIMKKMHSFLVILFSHNKILRANYYLQVIVNKSCKSLILLT